MPSTARLRTVHGRLWVRLKVGRKDGDVQQTITADPSDATTPSQTRLAVIDPGQSPMYRLLCSKRLATGLRPRHRATRTSIHLSENITLSDVHIDRNDARGRRATNDNILSRRIYTPSIHSGVINVVRANAARPTQHPSTPSAAARLAFVFPAGRYTSGRHSMILLASSDFSRPLRRADIRRRPLTKGQTQHEHEHRKLPSVETR